MKGVKKSLLILSFFVFFIPTSVFPQGPGGPGGGGAGDPACDPKCNCRADGSYCPIDSNLYILLGIAVLYGFKKVKDGKKPASD